MDAGIAESARRALYVLSHKECDKLEDTHCRYKPFRASGEAKTYIAPASAYEGTLNNVWSLLAAVNTALDDTNNTLYAAQQQIFTLEMQRRALEAALQNRSSQLPMKPQKDVPPRRPRGHTTTPLTPTQMPWQKIVLRFKLRIGSFCNL
jgi:hypothetical protein